MRRQRPRPRIRSLPTSAGPDRRVWFAPTTTPTASPPSPVGYRWKILPIATPGCPKFHGRPGPPQHLPRPRGTAGSGVSVVRAVRPGPRLTSRVVRRVSTFGFGVGAHLRRGATEKGLNPTVRATPRPHRRHPTPGWTPPARRRAPAVHARGIGVRNRHVCRRRIPAPRSCACFGGRAEWRCRRPHCQRCGGERTFPHRRGTWHTVPW